MRKLLLVLAILVFVANVMAISTTVEPGKLGKSGFTYPVKKVTGNEMRLNKGSVTIFDNQSAATLPGTKVGETIYNYQTNDNLHDRIVYDVATGKMHVQWMYGDAAEVPYFPNRHMYYNFYDGTDWKHQLGLPFENVRAGYGSLAATPSNAAVGASHHTTTGEEASIAWYDFIEGFGFFSPSIVWATRDHGSIMLEPFWPDIAVDGNNNWFVTTTNNNQDDFVLLVNDVNDNVIFWSSENQGATWSDYHPMFPDTTTYPLGTGASGPSEAGSHQVETSDLNDGTVGVLVSNAGHDFYLFESKDAGATFGEALWVIGNTFVEGTDDSLTYPARWDIIVNFDSTSGLPVDTSLYVFTGDVNTDTDEFEVEPNIRVSPHGPSDLFYLNGEPHIVWNELVHSGSNSYYPNGYGRWWTTPYTKYLSGDSTHLEAGFRIKHWSPSTGVATIYKNDDNTDVNPGTFQQYVTMPQVCADVDGNVYCLFTKYSDSDTLKPEDGITQADTDFGPLSFGRIWGAKSSDGGDTWGDAVQLVDEANSIHQNMRYISAANYNGNDAVNILYQSTPDVPGVCIGENSDHDVWQNADMMQWAIPTEDFPASKSIYFGPEIEVVIQSTIGGYDFGDIGDAGSASGEIIVKNMGDQDLTVTGLFTGDKAFSATPANFTVAPEGEQVVTITFSPKVSDAYSTYLAIPNNDPNEGSIGIPLEGMGAPTSAVNDMDLQKPAAFMLEQNYPNPFNPETTINFTIPGTGHVKLEVFTALGQLIDVLADEDMSAGLHSLTWAPQNVPTGIYFYRLTTDMQSSMRKMILMK